MIIKYAKCVATAMKQQHTNNNNNNTILPLFMMAVWLVWVVLEFLHCWIKCFCFYCSYVYAVDLVEENFQTIQKNFPCLSFSGCGGFLQDSHLLLLITVRLYDDATQRNAPHHQFSSPPQRYAEIKMTPSVVVKVPRKFHGQEYHETAIDNRRERLLYYVACVDAVEAPGGFTPKSSSIPTTTRSH